MQKLKLSGPHERGQIASKDALLGYFGTNLIVNLTEIPAVRKTFHSRLLHEMPHVEVRTIEALFHMYKLMKHDRLRDRD